MFPISAWVILTEDPSFFSIFWNNLANVTNFSYFSLCLFDLLFLVFEIL